jgi:hypothetical protein
MTGGARLVGRTVTEANLALMSLPAGDATPLRRVGFGVSLILDPKGSNLLEFLGDDVDERAATLDEFLSRCDDGEINELFLAFQAAVVRRAHHRNAAANDARRMT